MMPGIVVAVEINFVIVVAVVVAAVIVAVVVGYLLFPYFMYLMLL